MAKVSVMTPEKACAVASPDGSAGEIETLAYYDGNGDPIHMHMHHLKPDAEITVEGHPTDQLIYVWKGWASAGGVKLDERSSMIVEYRASERVTAGSDGAVVLAFHLKDRPSQPRPGGHVHLLPFESVPRTKSLSGSGKAGGALHADAGCPTCEIWLHENDFYQPDDETGLHSHSEDEIIFVRDGAIRLGNKLYGPGTALAIAANAKYAFRTGPDGLSFVNFRGASPTYTSADGSHVLDEAKFWRSELGPPQYLEPLNS